MKRWMGWTAAATVGLALTASTGFACEQHAQAAEAKDAKAPSAGVEAKGCDKPCCAKRDVAEAKNAVQVVPTVAVAAADAPKKCDKPCDAVKTADGKGSPKKAAPVAKDEPAKDAPKAEPAVAPGAGR